MSYSADEIAIKVSNVTKAYKIFDTPGQRFLYHMFKTKSGRDFVALDNISFEVKKGESFGIIGRNGSGKSTMLQILAGIIKATSGKIQINGKIAALLELGSGFDPESTGYENIYMNAAILGVSKEDIDDKVGEIIEFADIGDFVNQPVKTYSSGMFIRLAFAVAINVEADIILIDEALAVGDVFFRQKCYAKLDQLKEEGKTIILVSHGMNEVEQFCDRALLLDHGHSIMLDESRRVVREYYIIDQKNNNDKEKSNNESLKNSKRENEKEKVDFGGWQIKDDIFYNPGSSVEVSDEKASFVKIGLFDENGYSKRVFTQGEWAYFYYEIYVKENIDVPLVGTVLFNQQSVIVHGKDCLQEYMNLPDAVCGGSTIYYLQKIKLDLGIGEYTFDAGMATMKKADYDVRGKKNQEAVNETMERLCTKVKAGSFAVHGKSEGDPMQLMFHGLCGLSGEMELKVR